MSHSASMRCVNKGIRLNNLEKKIHLENQLLHIWSHFCPKTGGIISLEWTSLVDATIEVFSVSSRYLNKDGGHNKVWLSSVVIRNSTLRNIQQIPVEVTPMAKTLGSTPIRHRCDTFLSDRCLINIEPSVFAIWKAIRYDNTPSWPGGKCLLLAVTGSRDLLTWPAWCGAIIRPATQRQRNGCHFRGSGRWNCQVRRLNGAPSKRYGRVCPRMFNTRLYNSITC